MYVIDFYLIKDKLLLEHNMLNSPLDAAVAPIRAIIITTIKGNPWVYSDLSTVTILT